MKKNIVVIFILVFMIQILIGANEKVRITNGEWAPLTSEKLKNYGAISHLVTQAFKTEGVDVEYGFFAWNRGLELARAGEWDGTLLWGRTIDRENSFYYSKEPLYIEKNVFFHLKSRSFEWKSDEELRNTRIGVTKGYFYGEEFYRLKEKLNIKTLESYDDKSNLKNLLMGRVDFFLCASEIGIEIMEKELIKDEAALITYNLKPVSTQGDYLLLNKTKTGNKLLMDKFDRGLIKLKENGKYKDIMKELKR